MARSRRVPSPPAWTNQDLTVFHGTLDRYVQPILAAVNTTTGRRITDFGRGFYTTSLQRQAWDWAWKLSQTGHGGQPAVIWFRLNRNALSVLDALWFIRGNFDAGDFWSFVFHCRRGGLDHGRTTRGGWYDVVVGPVAGPWQRRHIMPGMDQISFHTTRAAAILDNSAKGYL